MPRFAANLSMMFNEVPFLERFARARAAGFEGVEFLFPYAHEPHEVADALKSAGLTQALFNMRLGYDFQHQCLGKFHLQVAVTVEVRHIDTHGCLRPTATIEADSGKERLVDERPIALIDPELIDPPVIGDIEVDATVAVELEARHERRDVRARRSVDKHALDDAVRPFDAADPYLVADGPQVAALDEGEQRGGVELATWVRLDPGRRQREDGVVAQCAALTNLSSTIEEMAVEAALTGDPRLVFQAIAYDPLTSAVLSLAEIKQMVNEMLRQNQDHLPQFNHFEA